MRRSLLIPTSPRRWPHSCPPTITARRAGITGCLVGSRPPHPPPGGRGTGQKPGPRRVPSAPPTSLMVRMWRPARSRPHSAVSPFSPRTTWWRTTSSPAGSLLLRSSVGSGRPPRRRIHRWPGACSRKASARTTWYRPSSPSHWVGSTPRRGSCSVSLPTPRPFQAFRNGTISSPRPCSRD